jgi:hypothetical protein
MNVARESSKQLISDYVSFESQYRIDCIQVGCLIFWLLKIRPIELIEANSDTCQRNPIYQVINEEFALFNALAILEIKQSYVANRNLIPNMIRSFCLQSEQDSLSLQSLVQCMEQICDSVPDYMTN